MINKIIIKEGNEIVGSIGINPEMVIAIVSSDNSTYYIRLEFLENKKIAIIRTGIHYYHIRNNNTEEQFSPILNEWYSESGNEYDIEKLFKIVKSQFNNLIDRKIEFDQSTILGFDFIVEAAITDFVLNLNRMRKEKDEAIKQVEKVLCLA